MMRLPRFLETWFSEFDVQLGMQCYQNLIVRQVNNEIFNAFLSITYDQ